MVGVVVRNALKELSVPTCFCSLEYLVVAVVVKASPTRATGSWRIKQVILAHSLTEYSSQERDCNRGLATVATSAAVHTVDKVRKAD